MCGGKLCRCGQDSGRGKPLPYGETGPLRLCVAMPLLFGTQPGRYVARPVLCYGWRCRSCAWARKARGDGVRRHAVPSQFYTKPMRSEAQPFQYSRVQFHCSAMHFPCCSEPCLCGRESGRMGGLCPTVLRFAFALPRLALPVLGRAIREAPLRGPDGGAGHLRHRRGRR